MAYRPVFSSRIHTLEHNQQRLFLARPEKLLQLFQPVTMLYENGRRLLFGLVATVLISLQGRHTDFAARFDAISERVLHLQVRTFPAKTTNPLAYALP
jgi:hypothetical protein